MNGHSKNKIPVLIIEVNNRAKTVIRQTMIFILTAIIKLTVLSKNQLKLINNNHRVHGGQMRMMMTKRMLGYESKQSKLIQLKIILG